MDGGQGIPPSLLLGLGEQTEAAIQLSGLCSNWECVLLVLPAINIGFALIT